MPTVAEYLRAWKGLYTNVNPHDTPPGTTVSQDNIGTTTPGTLGVRKGIIPLNYTGFTSAGSNDVMMMMKLDRQEAYWVIYELTNGTLKAIRNGAQLNIRTGMNTAQPICGVRERHGNALIINGIDRGSRWDALTPVVDELGIDAPTSAATFATASGGTSGGATAGAYSAAYRYVDKYGLPSNLSPIASITAPDNATFTYSSLLESSQDRCSSSGTKEIYRTTSGESDVFYLVGSTTAGATHFSDSFSDNDLSAQPNLPLFYDDGNLLANRFVPPPTNKPFLALYRDRAWFYGNVIYSTGTVEVQSGSQTTLRGTGTNWTPQMVGRYYLPAGGTATYLISAYTSATSLTLSTAAPIVAAGAAYKIVNPPSEQRLLYYSEADEPESVPNLQNALTIQENMQDHDFETGLVAHDQFLYILHERHIYALWFTQQPDIDASIQLMAERGCVNNRCWVVAAGTLYLLDQLGAYSVQGKNITPISDAIQDYWRDARLDFSKSQYWWAEYEPNERVVKFYVHFTGDTNTRPKHILCYSPMSNSWWTETAPWELGGGCRTTISGRLRLVAGSQLDTVFLTSEGFSDGITTALYGTVTSATGTTLTDSTAAFTSAVIGAPVAIVAGTGKGQIRVISGQTSTQLTVPTWTTTPDATSVYLVGAIGWIFKTGPMKFQTRSKDQVRLVNIAFQPTIYQANFDVRRYYNHDTVPQNQRIPYPRADGVVSRYNDPDMTVDMLVSRYAARSGLNAPGYIFIEFDDGIDDKNVSDRWVALEFRGFQGLDRIQIYNAQVVGVTQGEE